MFAKHKYTDCVYLDNSGAALYSKKQVASYCGRLKAGLYGNPHSSGPAGSATSEVVENTRLRILKFFRASPEEYDVVFTSGCTGALRLVSECFQFRAPQGKHTLKDRHDSGIEDVAVPENGHGPKVWMYDAAPMERGKPTMCYLQDNHTSVLGMREVPMAEGVQIVCVTPADMKKCVARRTVARDTQQTTGSEGVVRHMFVYPAQSNLSGVRYSLDWIRDVQRGCLEKNTEGPPGQWYVTLDVAAYVSTSVLDLSRAKPHFVTLSFYKIFGFPTGIGALLVHRSARHVLQKRFFGGGTVDMVHVTEAGFFPRANISMRLEDGTVPYLQILALNDGFDLVQGLGGGIGMRYITRHTGSLADYTVREMMKLRHGNGEELVKLYSPNLYRDPRRQGPVIAFNLKDSSGQFIGYASVVRPASSFNIQVRGGCHCNTGACHLVLGTNSDLFNKFHQAGHVCGDDIDLVDGRPTGCVRVSYGYYNTEKDAQKFLKFLSDTYVTAGPVAVTFKPTARFTALTMKRSRSQLFRTSSKVFDATLEAPSQLWQLVMSVVLYIWAWFSPDSAFVNKRHDFGLEPYDEPANEKTDQRPVKPLIKRHSTSSLIHRHSTPALLERRPSKSILKKSLSRQISFSDACEVATYDTESVEGEANGHVEGLTNGHVEDLSNGHVDVVTNGHVGNVEDEEEGVEAVVEALYVYPVKSCQPCKVEAWPLSPSGLLYDRGWMVVSDTGVSLTLKKEANLRLIRPALDLDANVLRLEADGYPTVTIPMTEDGNSDDDDGEEEEVESTLCHARVCGSRVTGRDCGDEVATWVSDVINKRGCRLVRQTHRREDAASGHALSLANQGQLLLLNMESVEALKGDMPRARDAEDEVSVEELVLRFRANIVVRGGVAFDEDRWQQVKIDGVPLTSQGQCSRCHMICIDTCSGEKSREPLATLARTRTGKLPFGIYLSLDNINDVTDATLEVGSDVTVTP